MADTSMNIKDRCYVVQVAPSKSSSSAGQGFKIDSRQFPRTGIPNIQFTCKKDHANEKPNDYKVTFFNLNSAHQSFLEQANAYIYLYAGYDKNVSLIAKGWIVDATTDRTTPDVKTVVTFYDGFKELRDTIISISYEKGASVHAIIKALASKLGMVVNISPNAKDAKYKHKGFSFRGRVDEALNKVCTKAQLIWSIQDGNIIVTNVNGNTQNKAYYISASTGMIGSPTRVKLASRKIDDDTPEKEEKRSKNSIKIETVEAQRHGWQIKCFLNASIKPGDVVVIKSTKTDCNGTYRIEDLTHNGSYYDSWTTEFVCVEDSSYTYNTTPV